MKPLVRLCLTVALVLPLLGPTTGTAMADETAKPTAETDAAAAEPAPETAAADADCGCGARSPGQLLETQRRMIDTTAEPGS